MRKRVKNSPPHLCTQRRRRWRRCFVLIPSGCVADDLVNNLERKDMKFSIANEKSVSKHDTDGSGFSATRHRHLPCRYEILECTQQNLGKNTNYSWNCRGLVSLFELHEAQQSYKIDSGSDDRFGLKGHRRKGHSKDWYNRKAPHLWNRDGVQIWARLTRQCEIVSTGLTYFTTCFLPLTM